MSEVAYLRHIARYSDVIRTGGVAFNPRTGQCGPVQATQVRSWGAACPPGYCPPDGLPEALNRYFAGDRAGCREIPWTVQFDGTEQAAAQTVVTVTGTSKVTMCPTRMLATQDGVAGANWFIRSIEFGNQNQILGGVDVPIVAFARDAFQVVPMVPDCLKAGQPFEITVMLDQDATPVARSMWLTFIGPMIG